MTQIPAGWYPDPDPDQPVPGAQRYWDGRQWTEHVHTPEAPTYSAPGAQTSGQVPFEAAGAMPGPMAGGLPGAGAATAGGRVSTPDGQRLAGWWHRVGAYLIDALITAVIVVTLALPWVREIGAAYGDFLDEVLRATETGAAAPDQTRLLADLAGPVLAVTLIGLLVNFVYNVGFLKWKAGTPGKLMTGLRVRLREAPGPLTWGTVLKRWIGQNWYVAVTVVPVLGGLASIYPLVDGLWPLWDGKRQALHDKVASTNVVRHRR